MTPTKDRNLIARQRVQIVNSTGLHARPAAAIASAAAKYNGCEIILHLNGQQAPALSVAAILILEAVKGSVIEVVAEGTDASQAVDDITEIITGGFGEEYCVVEGEGTHCGIAIAEAHILFDNTDDIPHYSINKQKVPAERKRLRSALAEVQTELDSISTEFTGPHVEDFQKLMKIMLREDCFTKLPSALIHQELVNAEWALKISVGKTTERFAQLADSILRSRADEYSLILMRLVNTLAAKAPKITKAMANRIVIANSVGPAEVIEYQRAGYSGFASCSGSKSSHAAIVARSVGMPAVMAVDISSLDVIAEDTLLAVDSDSGELHISPPKETVAALREKSRAQKSTVSRAQPRVGAPPRSLTRDGERVFIHANIDFPAEIHMAQQAGSEGIGLFRTEFLFLSQDSPPTEDEQFEVYSEVVEKFAPLPVTFRTADIGYDKQAAGMETSTSPLGMRAIRYSIHEPLLFKMQLRALLRASKLGNMNIMLPMIAHEHEMLSAHTLLKEAASELRMSHANLPELGAMIEIPGAAYILESLAESCGFFSVGTNDLLQYTLAVDRNIAQLAHLSNPCHPGFLALMGQIITTARQLKIHTTVCGEMAADPTVVRFLLALGLRDISMHPSHIEKIRANLRNYRLLHHERLARRLAACRSSTQAARLLAKFN